MTKIEFTKALSAAVTVSLTKTDMEDAWDTYLDLIQQLEEQDDSAGNQMEQLTEMDAKERLVWRTCLSEAGIELTPMQVDDYLKIVELALDS
jgi:cell division septal protein FtsQ